MSDVKDLLQRLVAATNQANVPFMIAGSFASTAHGLPRTTQDLDVVIDPPDLDALDTLVNASAEDTIVAKLEWSVQSGGSERQRRDVAGILATMEAGLDREYIARWVRALALEAEWEATLDL